MKTMIKFFVSRQHYYYSGERVVEISYPSIDYVGPDMLMEKYEDEGEYDDPKEALEGAIKVRDAWKKDNPEIDIGISFGHFDCCEGEPQELEDLRNEVNNFYNELPKCDVCGQILDENETYTLFNDPEFGKFCSEYCAEKALAESEDENET